MKVMGENCIVAGCSNTHKDGVSLFKFPEDKVLQGKDKTSSENKSSVEGPNQ